MIARLVLAAAAAAALAVGAAAAEPLQPDVLLIGDSVATGMLWHDDAIGVLQEGYDVEWQVAICRTTSGPGCPFDGERPPSLLDLLSARASVPPTVVVETGYNDPAATFGSAVDESVDALVARGARTVFWLTLRASETPYPELNSILAEALSRHPELHLVDWDGDSATHRNWFQNDGVHLVSAGGVAMAHLVHGSITESLDPLRAPTTTLPPLHRGRRYVASLQMTGGTAPYRFRIVSGHLPRGLHLSAAGRITGTPAVAGRLRFQAYVTDADGVDTLVQYGAR